MRLQSRLRSTKRRRRPNTRSLRARYVFTFTGMVLSVMRGLNWRWTRRNMTEGRRWTIYKCRDRADHILQPLLLPSTTITLFTPSTSITHSLSITPTEFLPNQHLPINHRRLYKETTCRYRKFHQREPRKDNQEGR